MIPYFTIALATLIDTLMGMGNTKDRLDLEILDGSLRGVGASFNQPQNSMMQVWLLLCLGAC
jgi:hypothetical protein